MFAYDTASKQTEKMEAGDRTETGFRKNKENTLK